MSWLNLASSVTPSHLVFFVGSLAAATTIISIVIGYGGQLLRANKSTVHELRGLHLPAFGINAASHFIWFIYGSACVFDAVIWLPNLLGTLISLLIVAVVLFRRKAGQTGPLKARTA